MASRTSYVAAAIFAMAAAFALTKTGRDALYFQKGGLYDLPQAYMGIALLSVPMAFLMLEAMRRLGPRLTRIVAPLTMTAMLVAFHGIARPGGGLVMTLFFMLVPLAFGVLFSLFWLLAADLLDGVGYVLLARAYSIVGAASIAGGLAGGLIAKALALHVDPRRFLLIGALLLTSAAVVASMAQRRFPPTMTTAPGVPAEAVVTGVWPVIRQRYSLLLLLTGMTASLVGVLVDFQFYLAAATSGGDGRQNASLFASVHVVLNGAALAVQLYLMPRLQRAVGVQGSLLVLPAALLGGAALLLANASLIARSLLRITEGGLRSSIHRVNWEQAYLPLSRAQRVAAKLLVDGAGARLAEGLAAVILLAWLKLVVAGGPLVGQGTHWVTYLLLGASLAWVGLTRTLGRSFVAAISAREAAEPFRPDIPLPET